MEEVVENESKITENVSGVSSEVKKFNASNLSQSKGLGSDAY